MTFDSTAFAGEIQKSLDFEPSIAEPVQLSLFDRARPEKGWAAKNPEKALAYLFVAPADDHIAEELLAG